MIVLRSTYDKALSEIEELNRFNQELTQELERYKKHEVICRSIELEDITSQIKHQTEKLNKIQADVKTALTKYAEYRRRIRFSEHLGAIQNFVQKLDGHGSSKIKAMLLSNKEQQKALIKNGDAWTISGDLQYNGSLSKGKARQKRTAAFIFKAFNAAVDNHIAMCSSKNLQTQYKRIHKEFHKANKYGSDSFFSIEPKFLDLRISELTLYFKYHIQLAIEKDEERAIKEQIAEENRVQREIESFIKQREKEEKSYKKKLKEAEKRATDSNDEHYKALQDEILALKQRLNNIHKEKERALSMAQMTRSGYVYIISNKDSFGDHVYKIGMTRRLNPLDRVKELGDASVPFPFKIHGIIQSEDAPGLEAQLHRDFESYRVNKDNFRKEFFRVPIELIQDKVEHYYGTYDLTDSVAVDEFNPETIGALV